MWVRCGLGSAEMLLGGGAPGLVTPGELGWRPQTLARSPGANWSPPLCCATLPPWGRSQSLVFIDG